MWYTLIIFALAASRLTAAPTAVRIATGEAYGSAIDEKKPDGGPLTENIRRIFREIGYAPTFEHMPWKRAYTETLKTSYIATFPWFRDPEREADFLFSDTLTVMPVVGIVKNDSPFTMLDFTSMRGKKSCDLLGSRGYDVLKEKADVQVAYVHDINQCYQMLLTGRIDFLFVHRETAESNRALGIKIIPDVLKYSLSLHLIVSKKLPGAAALIVAFNQTMQKLKAAHALNSVDLHEEMKP